MPEETPKPQQRYHLVLAGYLIPESEASAGLRVTHAAPAVVNTAAVARASYDVDVYAKTHQGWTAKLGIGFQTLTGTPHEIARLLERLLNATAASPTPLLQIGVPLQSVGGLSLCEAISHAKPDAIESGVGPHRITSIPWRYQYSGGPEYSASALGKLKAELAEFGYISLDADGEPACVSGKPPAESAPGIA